MKNKEVQFVFDSKIRRMSLPKAPVDRISKEGQNKNENYTEYEELPEYLEKGPTLSRKPRLSRIFG